MTTAPIVLVIASSGVGGVEKRLAEVWLHLAPRLPQLRMIVPQPTLEQLSSRRDLAALRDFGERITTVQVAGPGFAAMMRAILPALWRLPRGSVVHHILQSPPLIHRLRGHRVLLSWVGTTFPRVGEKPADWAVSTMSLRAAARIDVLNPEIMAQLRRRPRLSAKLSLTTGGTFVDFNHFRPAKQKRDEVVFLGSLVRKRGIVPFIKSIPAIARRLKASGHSARFIILGNRGNATDEVERLLAHDDFAGIEIELGTTTDPATVLSHAKIFVSLQTISNYPSKALAEAMACGCAPIITDVGESRLMADAQWATFIRANYQPQELANAIGEVLALDADQFALRSEANRRVAQQRFSPQSQADYFLRLYDEMSRPL